jgi:two-component system alkaline phosphatase synthesis response regulator PhoP
MSRVLVVEDLRLIAEALQEALAQQGHRVRTAGDGAAALAAAHEWDPDLLILDLMLPPPGPDGFEVLRRLRIEGCDAPVLILSARTLESDKVRGFRHGADDYVTKPFGTLELMARVDALLRRAQHDRGTREAWAPRTELRFGSFRVRPAAREVYRDEVPVVLRPREFDLLLTLLQRPGVVCTRDWLLEQVWGYAPDVVSRTVDTHIGSLRRKLRIGDEGPGTIETQRGVGYRLVP